MSATVTKIGTLSGVFGSPYTITLTGAAWIGDVVLIAIEIDKDNVQTVGVTDSQGNSWAQRVQETDGSDSISLFILESQLTHKLSSGDTIQLTFPTDGNVNALIYRLGDVTPTSPRDQLINGFGSSSTPTTGTLTPGSSPVIAFAAFGLIATFSSYGNIMGSAATGLDNTGLLDSRCLVTEWRRLTSTTAGTAGIAVSAGVTFMYAFLTYKEAPTGDSLLTEAGDHILQESGDLILIDVPPILSFDPEDIYRWNSDWSKDVVIRPEMMPNDHYVYHPGTHVTQVGIEVITAGNPAAEITQLGLEILIPNAQVAIQEPHEDVFYAGYNAAKLGRSLLYDYQAEMQSYYPIVIAPTLFVAVDDVENFVTALPRFPVEYDHIAETDEPGQLGPPAFVIQDEVSERFVLNTVVQYDHTAETDEPGALGAPAFAIQDEISERFVGPPPIIYDHTAETDEPGSVPNPPTAYDSDDLQQFTARTAVYFDDSDYTYPPTPVVVVNTAADQDAEQGRWVAWSALQLDDTDAGLGFVSAPPFAIDQDTENAKWSDWRKVQHEDTETQRSDAPTPPFAIDQDAEQSKWVGIVILQTDDTDTQRVSAPTPPFAIDQDSEQARWSDWKMSQTYDTETQRPDPPAPPPAIEQDGEQSMWRGLVFRQYEDTDTQRMDAPTPPFAIDQDAEQAKWVAWSSPALDDDHNFQTPPPPIPEIDMGQDSIEAHIKAVDFIALYHEDDASWIAPTPPFAIDQDTEQSRWIEWRAFQYDDTDSQSESAVFPVYFIVRDQDAEHAKWVDWKAFQYEDTETQRAYPPPPIMALEQDSEIAHWVDWRAFQYEDTETQRASAPTPPFAIDQSNQELKWVGVRTLQYDETDTANTYPPAPPVITQNLSTDQEFAYFKPAPWNIAIVEEFTAIGSFYSAAFTLSANSDIVSTATLTMPVAATLSSSADLSALGLGIFNVSASLDGSATVTATPNLNIPALIGLSANADLSMSMLLTLVAQTQIAGAATFSLQTQMNMVAQTILDAHALIVPFGGLICFANASLAAFAQCAIGQALALNLVIAAEVDSLTFSVQSANMRFASITAIDDLQFISIQVDDDLKDTGSNPDDDLDFTDVEANDD